MRTGDFKYITEKDVYAVVVKTENKPEETLVNEQANIKKLDPQDPQQKTGRDFTYNEIISGYT
ncbi:MAG: hypothetical protein WCO65_02495 [bacterium]